MDLALEKRLLVDKLNAIDDIHLIRAIKEMLNYANNIRERQDSFVDKELISRLNSSEEDIANGRTISLDDVRKKYKP